MCPSSKTHKVFYGTCKLKMQFERCQGLFVGFSEFSVNICGQVSMVLLAWRFSRQLNMPFTNKSAGLSFEKHYETQTTPPFIFQCQHMVGCQQFCLHSNLLNSSMCFYQHICRTERNTAHKRRDSLQSKWHVLELALFVMSVNTMKD